MITNHLLVDIKPTCRSIGLKPQTDLQKYTFKMTLFFLAIKGQKYVRYL